MEDLAGSYDHIFLGHGQRSDIPFDARKFARHLAELQHEFRAEAVFENAEEAAADFSWPVAALTRDREALLRLDGSIEAVIREKHDKRKKNGFSPAIVDAHYSGDPEVALLREIAESGAVIDTAPDFVRIPPEAQERPITTRIPKALGMHACKLLSKDRAVLLPVESLSEAQLGKLSFCGLHLAYKSEDPLGRFCIDPSNTQPGIVPINGDEAKQLSIERYGKVNHPGIQQILGRWCTWRLQQNMVWSDVWCYKEDVQSAFPQFSMNADGALKLACMIAVGLILIFTAGGFGWCGAPMVFEVIMAAATRVILSKVDGPSDRYCDDVFGIGTLVSAAHDALVVRMQILLTFGDGSVALDKSWLDQHAVILGWHIDFPRNQVRPSDRGIRKLAYAFFSVNMFEGQPLVKWQELHSLAERYSDGLLGASGFVQPLQDMLQGEARTGAERAGRRRVKLRHASSAARFAIEMWRVFSVRLWQNSSAYAMPIEQFAGYYDTERLSQRIAVSDSSTPRVAVGIYDKQPDGSRMLVAWTGYDYPSFAYCEERPAINFQCQREFLGLLVSLILNASISSEAESASQHVTWVNDNTAALAWAAAGRCARASGQAMSMAVSWFQLCSNTHFHQVEFLAGNEMGDIDSQSRIHERGMSSPTLVPEKYVDLQEVLDRSGLMHACDPSRVHSSEADHHAVFKLIHERLNGLIREIRRHQQGER
jgi:hypothetical protein